MTEITTSQKDTLREIFEKSNADAIMALDKDGEETSVLFKKNGDEVEKKYFPIVMEHYKWSKEEQIAKAEKFRDRIEYLYHPEDDVDHPMLPIWRFDDTARLEATLKLPFGKKVLEAGCSSGTVSIEVAKLSIVQEVVGVDIRIDAINRAKLLVEELVSKGVLNDLEKNKLTFNEQS